MDHEGMRRATKAAMPDPDALTVDVRPPEGRKYWLEESMLPQDRLGNIKPMFKVGEVAKIFFARSPDWLRWLGAQQKEETDNVLNARRTGSGSRIYTLVDVERIAHVLLSTGKINARQFTGAINVIRWMAYQYGILNELDLVPKEDPEDCGADQQVIPLVDEEIAAALKRSSGCEQCQKDKHGDCETSARIAQMAWKGETVLQIADPCPCYAADIPLHE